MTSTATAAAAKGMSVLTKWIIGGTAAAVVGVTTTVLVMQPSEKTPEKKAPQETVQTAASPVQQDSEEPATTTLNAQQANTPQLTLQQNSTVYLSGSQVAGPITYILPDARIADRDVTQSSVVLPDVLPTIVPANSETIQLDFDYLPENKQELKTPEAIAHTTEENVTQKESVLKIPNVFTPDGDNINDEFFVTSANISDAEIIIQNDENKVVYRSNDIHFRWNGRINGTDDPVETGMYACVIVYKDAAGKTQKKIQLLEIERRR